MSSSRTTAAQRRRNGPPDLQGQTPIQRGPSTSIQSTSAFSQPPQIRAGTTGRLAGQQASVAQQQQQQQQYQQNAATASSSKPKMSVPQAITLITLRLGRLENQLQSLDLQKDGEGEGESEGVNNELLEHIIQRIDTLEQKCLEIDHTKQQLELIKPVMANTKTLSSTSSKEIKDLKTTVDKFKNELQSLQGIVSCLQTFVTSVDNEEPVEEKPVEEAVVLTLEDPVNLVEENTSAIEETSTNINDDSLISNISLKDIIQTDF